MLCATFYSREERLDRECFAVLPLLASLVETLNCEPSALSISAYVFFLLFSREERLDRECFAVLPWLASLVQNLNCEPSSLSISAYVFFLLCLRQSDTRCATVCSFFCWRVEASGSRFSLARTDASRQRETHPNSRIMLTRPTPKIATAKKGCTQAGSGKRGGGGKEGGASTGLNGRGSVRGGMAGGGICGGWLGKGGGCGRGGGGGGCGGGGFEGGLLRSTAQLAMPARGYHAPT